MENLAEGIQSALNYMEAHLDEEMDMNVIAGRAYVSGFYFQRIFQVLCGMGVGEYIRARRLTRAGEELAATSARVIDVALRWGYESPDSFARAFQRFHGISPSAAREEGACLRTFAPLHIKLTLEGGNMMEYRIEEKASFTLVGKARSFPSDRGYQEVPRFWNEFLAERYKAVCGQFGLCMDNEQDSFRYMIADVYLPWKEIPAGYETKEIPAGTWAVFTCHGPLPEALQTLNTRIWREWMPACKTWKVSGDYNLEVYSPPCNHPEDDYNEIWIPVVKA